MGKKNKRQDSSDIEGVERRPTKVERKEMGDKKRQSSDTATKDSDDSFSDIVGTDSEHQHHELMDMLGAMRSDQLAIKSAISEIRQDHNSLKDYLDEKIDSMKGSLMKQLASQFDTFKEQIDTGMARFDERIAKIENQIVDFKEPEYQVEKTCVVINLKEKSDEDINKMCIDLVKKGMGLQNITPKRCKRLESHTDKPGVVKMELKSKEDKIDVLRAKENLKANGYPRVYVRASQTHEERVARMNMQTILKELPNGKDFRITGHGKLVRNNQDPPMRHNPQEHQHQQQQQRQQQQQQSSERQSASASAFEHENLYNINWPSEQEEDDLRQNGAIGRGRGRGGGRGRGRGQGTIGSRSSGHPDHSPRSDGNYRGDRTRDRKSSGNGNPREDRQLRGEGNGNGSKDRQGERRDREKTSNPV